MTDPSAGDTALAALETAYGAPSQAAFGSAVFTETVAASDALASRAKAWYAHFLGDQ